jgi:hypothetical protein
VTIPDRPTKPEVEAAYKVGEHVRDCILCLPSVVTFALMVNLNKREIRGMTTAMCHVGSELVEEYEKVAT